MRKFTRRICFPHLFAGSGRHSEESAMCAMLLPNMPNFPLYELSCLIFFLVPMLSIAVLYVRMGLRIQSNGLGHSIEGSVHGETRQAQSRKAIIRMLSKFPSFPNITHTTSPHPYRENIPCTWKNLRNASQIYRTAWISRFISVFFFIISFISPRSRQALLHTFYKSHAIEFHITVNSFNGLLKGTKSKIRLNSTWSGFVSKIILYFW